MPFATIHRWFVSDPEDPDKQIEVLVVEKVGQIGERDGCAVGLVLATGNPNANEMARKIADEQARDFACGADERVIVGDPMPEFSRHSRTDGSSCGYLPSPGQSPRRSSSWPSQRRTSRRS